MRILFVHNYYRSSVPSGENSVVDAEIAMLKHHGHEVEVFRRDNDEIRKHGIIGILLSLVSIIVNPKAAFDLWKFVKAYKPDVVHIHNLFPLISPLALLSLGKIPRVMTLHNYRLFCAGETVCREGRPCLLCIETSNLMHALVHRCYRGSLVTTSLVVVSIFICQLFRIWQKYIDKYVVLTEFQREVVMRAGLSGDKVVVKANHISNHGCLKSWESRKDAVVFVGRLSHEKGCDVLIRAWKQIGNRSPKLYIYGDGADACKYKKLAEGLNIEFKGKVDRTMVIEAIADSKMLIVPSLCYEGLPTTILEAYSVGTPVLVSNLGPLPIIVKSGITGEVFLAGSVESLCDSFLRLYYSDGISEIGRNAYNEYLKFYTEQVNYDHQISIYKELLEQNQRSKEL